MKFLPSAEKSGFSFSVYTLLEASLSEELVVKASVWGSRLWLPCSADLLSLPIQIYMQAYLFILISLPRSQPVDWSSDWCGEEGGWWARAPVPDRVAPRRSLQRQVPRSGSSGGVWT